jgi:putative ABC transport system substrate-binding protein
MEPGMASKWLELLKEIAPRVARVAFLFNPTTAPYAECYLKPFKTAAPSFAVEAVTAPVHDKSELTTLITTLAHEHGGIIVMPDAFTDTHRAEIISLAARNGLTAVYPFQYWAEGGIAYGEGLLRRRFFNVTVASTASLRSPPAAITRSSAA